MCLKIESKSYTCRNLAGNSLIPAEGPLVAVDEFFSTVSGLVFSVFIMTMVMHNDD